MPDESDFLNPQDALADAIAVTHTVLLPRVTRSASDLHAWAEHLLKELGDAGATQEIEELLRAGCKLVPLACVAWLSMKLSRFPDTFYTAVGDHDRISKMVQQFEDAALLFDGLSRGISQPESHDWFTAFAVPSPAQMAANLRLYKSLDFIKVLFSGLNLRSGKDIERHMPVSYVRHATGEWHDREVSALISAFTGTPLDEGTHRAWRNRSFSRIAVDWDFLWRLAQLLPLENDSTT